MTVNSTNTRELTIDKVVLRSYQLAGLMGAAEGTSSPQWEQKSAMARDHLEATIDSLQARGVTVRGLDFYELAIVASTGTYDMPAGTLNIIGDGQWLPTGQTTGSIPVMQMSQADYQRLTNKTTEGTPFQFYANRADSIVTVHLYHVPEEAGTITFRRQSLLGDNNDGSATLDLERHWLDYVMWELAHKLAWAHSLDASTKSGLEKRADKALKEARGYSGEHVDTQFYNDEGDYR